MLTRYRTHLFGLAVALLASAGNSDAQDAGAAALANALAFLRADVPRVLYIAAHPDDEDQRMIAWLSRGGHAEVAYLSLTRGEGGQNVIGNELGAALGVLRTEELLSARRVDGGAQFFARGFDFGFSKSAEETFSHWPRDSLLADVVRIVRAFRPHVLMTRFSGGPTDGHGQHQVSGILARDAYDVADDTVRFPVRQFGAPWRPLKLYRDSRFSELPPTIRINVGAYEPLSGRSYAEIAGLSRSQHRSQGFGRNDRPGPVWATYHREASRVNENTPATEERSLFDGIPAAPRGSASARRADPRSAHVDYTRPESALPLIATYSPRDAAERARYDRAALLAAAVAFEALSAREVVAVGDTVTVTYAVYNRGTVPIRVDSAATGFPRSWIPPDSFATWTAVLRATQLSQPWWLAQPPRGDLYSVPVPGVPEAEIERRRWSRALIRVEGLALPARAAAPITFRRTGFLAEDYTPLTVTPGFTVTPARDVWYIRSGVPFERLLNVTIRSSYPAERDVIVRPQLPAGVVAEPREHRLRPAAGRARTVSFRLRGTLRPGPYVFGVEARSGGETFTQAVQHVSYEHIDPRMLFRPAQVRVTAVDVAIPPGLAVGYIPGMGDEGPHVLSELGIDVTPISPDEIPRADLSRFGTIVVGPRAYEAHAELLEHNQRLFDYANSGGRLVVQYGQDLMGRSGVLPYRVRIDRPPVRVTDAAAPVVFTDPDAPELNYPNRITHSDFAGWVQERITFAPREFDSRFRTFLASSDPGEQPVHSSVIVAPLGNGTYVYTTLALFRQFIEGVPGAARLFVNLLAPPRQ